MAGHVNDFSWSVVRAALVLHTLTMFPRLIIRAHYVLFKEVGVQTLSL